MRINLLFFCSGIVLAHQVPSVPPIWLAPLALLAALPLLWFPRLRWLWMLLVGAALTFYVVFHALGERITDDMVGVIVPLEGRIHGIPSMVGQSMQFEFRPSAASRGDLPRRLHVRWYNPPVNLDAGSIWHLRVRLQAVGGTLNPGGFDRERYALLSRIGARGAVVNDAGNRQLRAGHGLDYVRQSLSALIRTHISDADAAALAVALGVGDRQYISPELRNRLQITGTAHLIAISGLHIGLVSGGTWMIVGFLWRLAGSPAARYPASLLAIFPAMTMGVLYAALAGFALSTQRALIMVALAFVALLARRRTSPWGVLLLALTGVLLIDPIAPLGAGLWLSFGAVAALFWVMRGHRVGGAVSARRFIGLQLALLVALAPLTLWWFGQIAWLAPVANTLAITLVGSFVVPLLLTGLGISVLSESIAGFLLAWSGWLLALLNHGLSVLTSVSPESTNQTVPPLLLLLVAIIGSVVLLLPRGLPGKAGGLGLLGLALAWQPPLPAPGHGRVTLMDTGHGHALLVQTRNHALLYDTGPAFMGRDVHNVLRFQGVGQLNRLVLSNRRAGSIGGASSLNVPLLETVGHEQDTGCSDVPPWTWDQVDFRFLDGEDGVTGHCILLVEAGDDRLLVAHAMTPGSASAIAARGLVGEVTWLVVPGHGHRQIISAAFAAELRPSVVLIPINAQNRYGLPHPEGLAIWRDAGALIRSTGLDGAITLHLGSGQHATLRASGRYWSR